MCTVGFVIVTFYLFDPFSVSKIIRWKYWARYFDHENETVDRVLTISELFTRPWSTCNNWICSKLFSSVFYKPSLCRPIMAPPPSVSAHHVIVDSGGFISNAPIKDLAPNVYCIQEVVNEIKDKATKQRLQVIVTCQN